MNTIKCMLPKPKRVQNKALLEHFKRKECVVCGSRPCDAHHLTTKGAGGGDTENNLIPLCRWHHSKIHSMGIQTFITTYPSVESYIKSIRRYELIDGLLETLT